MHRDSSEHYFNSQMKTEFTDYNNVNDHISSHWPAIESAIAGLHLRLKASDQDRIQGNPIFDPVGTNAALKSALEAAGWASNVTIPAAYEFLGTDIDFEKDGVVLEVQFSNYPFLLNNVVRTHLFSRRQVYFNANVPRALIVITKCKVFPASNSTLYYEQGKKQLDVLARPEVFDLPIRLVGLSEDVGSNVPCVYTTYQNSRYSRTVVSQDHKTCRIRSAGARARLEVE
jgi:hypothetical protein